MHANITVVNVNVNPIENCPEDKGQHCCYSMALAVDWDKSVTFDVFINGEGEEARDYSLNENGRSGSTLNFCPFCGSVLPGAYVTDWELHEKCESCHWTGSREDANIPLCICSKSYEELKAKQDEANSSNQKWRWAGHGLCT